MAKKEVRRISVCALLVICLLFGVFYNAGKTAITQVFAIAESDLTGSGTAVTVDADFEIANNITVSAKTVTIPAGVTLSVAAGKKLTIDTNAKFVVSGSLVFADTADSNIKGEVRVNEGGFFNDQNSDADWNWNHGALTGKIVMQKGGKLTLNGTLFVGEQADGAYITVMSGNWAAEKDSAGKALDRLVIEDGDVYALNGITSINKTLPEYRIWHVGKDAHVNLCANNRIKFVGPEEAGKARINTFDPVNSIYYSAVNVVKGSMFLGDSTYSWIDKQWKKVGPYIGMNGLDLDALLGLIGELGMAGYDQSAQHGGSTWNGVNYKIPDGVQTWEVDKFPAYTNDAGPDGIRYRDIKYAERGGIKNSIDLYIPAGYNANDEIPLVVHMYGGGWTDGTKAAEEGIAARFAKAGYAVAAVDYRLAGYSEKSGNPEDDGTFSQMMEDIEDSVKAAKKKIEELGYRTSVMATTGGSAGAHLSMMYAYMHGDNTTDRNGNANALIPVALAMTNCGPTDFKWDSWLYSSSYIPYYDEEGRLLSEADHITAAAGLSGGLLAINGLFEAEIDVTVNVVTKAAGVTPSMDYTTVIDRITDGALVDGKIKMEVDATVTVEVRAKNAGESETDYAKVVDAAKAAAEKAATDKANETATKKFVDVHVIPWSTEAETVNMKISPSAMIRDAIEKAAAGQTSVYYNVPTLGLYGGQDTLCSGENAQKLIDALALDPTGGHYIVFSDLMGHTLAEDSTAILDNYNKTTELLETYLRGGKKQVAFKADGTVIARFNVAPGGTLAKTDFPSIPDKAGYTTLDWDKTADIANITADMTVTAKYQGNPYKMIFKVGDTVINTKNGVYGTEAIAIPKVPEKEGYTGAWDTDDFTFGDQDRTISAVYTVSKYTVTFMDGEKVFATKTVDHNGTLTDIPEAPWKFGFTVTWSMSDYSGITGNTIVTAVYAEDVDEAPVDDKKGCNKKDSAAVSVPMLSIAALFVFLRRRS